MDIIKWHPAADLLNMQKNIKKIFEKSFDNTLNGDWNPPVDIVENDKHIILLMELPGVSEEDMEININGGILSIAGNKKSVEEKYGDNNCYRFESVCGRFRRSFAIPVTVNSSEIKAKLKDGVLKITLMKYLR